MSGLALPGLSLPWLSLPWLALSRLSLSGLPLSGLAGLSALGGLGEWGVRWEATFDGKGILCERICKGVQRLVEGIKSLCKGLCGFGIGERGAARGLRG